MESFYLNGQNRIVVHLIRKQQKRSMLDLDLDGVEDDSTRLELQQSDQLLEASSFHYKYHL